MAGYIPLLAAAVLALVSMSLGADVPPESESADTRTLGLFRPRGNRYYDDYYQPQPFSSGILGNLFGSLFGQRTNPYYAPQYYGNGYGGGSPFIGGRPVNPGPNYRPGFTPGYGGYQQYPGGYAGGVYRDLQV